MSSSDGVTWADTRTTGGYTIKDFTWGPVGYVIVGNSGTILTTTDLINVTARTSGTTQAINCVCYGDSGYLAGCQGGDITYSTNGSTWTKKTITGYTTKAWKGVTYRNGLYILSASDGTIAMSRNLVNWSIHDAGANGGSELGCPLASDSNDLIIRLNDLASTNRIQIASFINMSTLIENTVTI